MKFIAEYTDTFGGEANYSWVRNATFEAPDTASTPLLVRRAKRALGITGPHKTTDFGDMVEVRPQGKCTVVFVSVVPPGWE